MMLDVGYLPFAGISMDVVDVVGCGSKPRPVDDTTMAGIPPNGFPTWRTGTPLHYPRKDERI